MNPRSHLRLVYEANPLSFLSEQVRVQLCLFNDNYMFPARGLGVYVAHLYYPLIVITLPYPTLPYHYPVVNTPLLSSYYQPSSPKLRAGPQAAQLDSVPIAASSLAAASSWGGIPRSQFRKRGLVLESFPGRTHLSSLCKRTDVCKEDVLFFTLFFEEQFGPREWPQSQTITGRHAQVKKITYPVVDTYA
jgi:hypothetical protein